MVRKVKRIKSLGRSGVRRGTNGSIVKEPSSGGVYMFATQQSGKSFTRFGGASGNLIFKIIGRKK